MNRADATKALNDLTADFEKNAAALRAIIEAPEKPSRWEPGPDGGEYFTNIEGYAGPQARARRPHSEYLYQIRLSRGDVHQTEAEARTYNLWLESFVPVYGLTVPSEEVLRGGWSIAIHDFSGEVTTYAVEVDYLTWLTKIYLEGLWHPTREAAEAWLERFGKVRGFRK